ncbi:ABC transporter transmembrane domain-containing protein [Anaerobranca gottschalkii]|uniref:ABC-type multidrug transport system, ATPase and permease component n=1 Tax=Anaerobranca gottschalkii DSM 13577 TaxID=1120990 RepID=A0A1I0C4B1_9FIRM|nr:ABC transporter ATP-binding protein [Anaerobranca gottschalkii]SET14332.1 ABC-type multidrug transport system, ATPase and permease component [Anaerobranca gottschalkii DSM 13577]
MDQMRFKIMHGFWKKYVWKYKANWIVAFCLNVVFFAVSAIIPFVFKGVIDSFTIYDSIINPWILAFIIIEGLQIILLYSKGYACRLLELKVKKDIKTQMYSKFFTASYLTSNKIKPGEAIQRITSDAASTGPLIVESFSELVGHLILVTITVVLMFVLSPHLAISSVFFIIIYSIGYKRYQKNAPILANDRQKANANFIATLEEGLDANYSVRVQGSYRSILDIFNKSIDEFLAKSFKFYKYNLKFQGVFSSLISYATSVTVILLGAWLFSRGLTTIGTIVAFSQYINWLVVFVNFMSNYATQIEPSIVSLNRVEEILNWESQLKFEEDVKGKEKINNLAQNAIEIRNLDFSFKDVNIFNKLNLSIPTGKITFIKGVSGRGKSSLLNILLKLYPVEEGKVFINGIDINSLDEGDIMGLISVVEQEPKFFGNDISDCFSTFDNFSLNDLKSKAKKLGLDKVLDKILKSTNKGKLKDLSGGERKRLGILRGLSRETPIIVMDEPTAFIDDKTARSILTNAIKLYPNKTFIIITHDSSIEDLADLVIEI